MSKPKPAEYDKFIKLLENWDYHYYQHSNRTLYLKGKKQEQKLIELASTNTYLQAILKQFHILKNTEIATERKAELKILEELKVEAMS